MPAAVTTPRALAQRYLLLGAVLLVTLLLAVRIGAVRLDNGQVLDALRGRADPATSTIVLGLRLPRVVLAALCGAALSMSGATYQALLRNALAEPYILGVSSGAAAGAVAATVFGLDAYGPWIIPVFAFVGSLVAIALVLRVAFTEGRVLDHRTLILAGVVVGAFGNAVVLLFLTFSDADAFRSAVFWLMGSLAGATWGRVLLLAIPLVVSGALLFGLARSLDLLSVGEPTAAALGVPVERIKYACFVLAAVLAATAVAVSGVIGFVGLLVPHAVRLKWGSGHRQLMPAAALTGAIFLVATDALARTVAAPTELPLGVITALLGVPLFVVLLRRGHA
jgi:iron complex transport system permease protein